MENYILKQISIFNEKIRQITERNESERLELEDKIGTLIKRNEKYTKNWFGQWDSQRVNKYKTQTPHEIAWLQEEDIIKDIEHDGLHVEEIGSSSLRLVREYQILQLNIVTEFSFIKDEVNFDKESELLQQIEIFKWGKTFEEMRKKMTPEYIAIDPGMINQFKYPPHIKIASELLSSFSIVIAIEQFTHHSSRFLRQLEIKLKIIKSKVEAGSSYAPLAAINPTEYINSGRINELRAINNVNFDLAKLIRICEELNDNWQNGNYYSVIALVRTILNHCSTALGHSSFEQVANNYNGGQSFKKIAKNLFESAKNIADSHLHHQMQKNDPLPNETQVDFRTNIDFLLAELIKTLR